METNLNLESGKQLALSNAADKLMTAAMDYWTAYREATGGAAVVWVKDESGRMVILTRGEYRSTLMNNIETLIRNEEHIFNYDGA